MRLLARDRSGPLSNLIGKGLNLHSSAKLPQKSLPSLPLCVRPRPFDTVRELNDSYRRQSGLGFAPYLLNLLQYVGNAVVAPFRRDQDAGIDYQSQDVGFQGCRLRTISSISSAKSGSSTAAEPRSFSHRLAMAMDSDSKRPGCSAGFMIATGL